MFAEQRHRSFFTPRPKETHDPSPDSLFSRAADYAKELPLSEKEKETVEKLHIFDLSYSFVGLPDLVDLFGKDRGIFQAVLGVLLNIWTIRQELLGQIDTRELITLVRRSPEGRMLFQNDLYGQAHDLESMFLSGVEFVDERMRPRFSREARQAIELFRLLTSPLQTLDFSMPTQQVEEKLRFLGYHPEKISVSPAMIALIPSLREQIRSIDDLERALKANLTLEAWVSPIQTITVSPPHWSHGQGDTAFVWASESIVLPNTGEIFIRQNGKFGKSTEDELLPYLAIGQTARKEFYSEDELMAYINVFLDVDYRQPKVLLDHLVGLLGGIREAGKVDQKIKPGNFPTRIYFDELTRLFTFEYEQLQKSGMTTTLGRLGELSDILLHKICRNTAKGLHQSINEYMQLVQQDPHISDKKFATSFTPVAIQMDQGLRTSIDLSLLDCTVGSLTSFANPQALGSLQASLGAERLGLLRRLETESISNRAEFESIARSFGKDPHRFKDWGKCRNPACESARHGHNNFLGECGWCLSCELKDDLGLNGSLADLLETDTGIDEATEHAARLGGTPMGLTGFVAGLANRRVYEDYLFH